MSTSGVTDTSVWTDFELPRFPALENSLEVDVVVVGAGLTGITTAYLLRKEGVRVALLERARVASADTSRTTAHLTYVTDERLGVLVDKFGKDAARAFWEAGAGAIDQIWQLARETQAECDFRWVPGYLFAPLHDEASKAEREKLQLDAALAAEFGLEARLVESVPWTHRPGVRFAHQAKFHPFKYLAAMVQAIPGDGSHVFEDSSMDEVQSEPLTVRSGDHRIRCKYLVIATHNPLMGEKGAVPSTLFQTKLALYTSYVLGARLPKGSLPEALYWDTCDPYNYLRIDEKGDYQYAIFGGEDVKTGQEHDVRSIFAKLEARLHAKLPQAKVERRWMGQVVETPDGLPFIGENTERQFIATGFCGNGLTLGTLGAMMARDRYLNRDNPWFDLLRVDRRPFHGGLWRYAKENVDYPYYLLRGRLEGVKEFDPERLANGEARLLKWQGRKIAAFRSESGELSLCSPVCTHLKCLVRWNAADRTWDCPCHGSRFFPDGRVLSGPAEEPLEKISVSKPG